MILDLEKLPLIRGQVLMIDGSFDPLHDGHIRYMEFAATFGLPVFCNIASDSWTVSKHKVMLEQERRAVVLDAIRFVDYVFCSSTSTADVLQMVQPKIYLKGADWQARGGIPDLESSICKDLGIEVVYANTLMNSSSEILKRFMDKDFNDGN